MAEKVGVVFFHNNISMLYRPEWVEKCIGSMAGQTQEGATIYEIDYGGRGERLTGTQNYHSAALVNYAEAMNAIIDAAFADGCDFVFNTNMDDFYSADRVEKQLAPLRAGYDIVSSDFVYVDEDDKIMRRMHISSYGDIAFNIARGHNVIAHPCVAYSRRFWSDASNRYDPAKVPAEDLDLWGRSITRGYRFHIHPDVLLYYRIHAKKESNKKQAACQ